MAEAAAWYEQRVAGLGDRFLSEVEGTFARVDATPLIGPLWIHSRLPAGVRRMFLRSFPYSVVSSSSHDSPSLQSRMLADGLDTGRNG
jgi:hypothetical protein